MIDKTSKLEVKVENGVIDEDGRLNDVIYGIDVKEQALELYEQGYAAVNGINVKEMDFAFKPKKGEITVLTGIGNYGKSSWKM